MMVSLSSDCVAKIAAIGQVKSLGLPPTDKYDKWPSLDGKVQPVKAELAESFYYYETTLFFATDLFQ